jgi:hypothetical protein
MIDFDFPINLRFPSFYLHVYALSEKNNYMALYGQSTWIVEDIVT